MRYKKITVLVGIAFLACLGIGYYVYAATVISIDEAAYYPVISVMDGDTFKAKIGRHTITVRMLGIDTPETVDPRKPQQCYGNEASDETKGLLSGRQVRLGLSPDREEKDRYGRYLAYAYRDDRLFVNEHLLQNGFAREYTFGTVYSMQTEFRQSEAQAKQENKGLWGACPEENVKK